MHDDLSTAEPARTTRLRRLAVSAMLLFETALAAAPHANGSPPSWRWPLDGQQIVTRPFDAVSSYAAGHRGVDLAASPGAAILAPAAGTLRFAGFIVDRPVLSIQHLDGSITSYEPAVSELSPGDAITAGQHVGTVSPTHRHTPDGSLHVGLRVDGAYVDPASRLAPSTPPRAVLLPLGE